MPIMPQNMLQSPLQGGASSGAPAQSSAIVPTTLGPRGSPQQSMAPQSSAPPTQSIEQRALAPGVQNKQQISNFMGALNGVGAGGNNSFMNSQPAPVNNFSNLVDPNAVNANNGSQVGNNTMSGSLGQNSSAAFSQPVSQPTFNPGNVQGPGQPPPPSNPPPFPAPKPIGPGGGIGPGFGGGLPHAQGSPQPQMGMPMAGQPSPSASAAPQSAMRQNFMPMAGQPAAPAPQSSMPMQSSAPASMQAATQDDSQSPSASSAPAMGAPQPMVQNFMPLMSDERAKTNIESATPNLVDFLNKIGAHSYNYKNKQDGIGTFTSPMAQELEKTELGKQAVIETPRGKMVDYGRLGGVNLAAVSVVHRETERLKKQFQDLKKQFNRKK